MQMLKNWNVGENWLMLDYYHLDLNDPETWQLICEGRTVGVFQLEKFLGRKWSKKLEPTNIEELAALTALLRPGCLKAKDEETELSMTELFCQRKHGTQPTKYLHPALESILSNTYGVLTYQEQMLEIAKSIAGFNLQEADQLRRCVSGDTMFVSKSRGWISIDTLLKDGYKNDLFLIMDELGQQTWKKIEDIWSTGKHDCITVTSSSGLKVKATKLHQFLCSDGWKARRKLTKKDFLITSQSVEWDGKNEISDSMAIIIAGLITEGYVPHMKDCGHATFVNHDKNIMKTFSNAMLEEFGIKNPGPDTKVFYIKRGFKEQICRYLSTGLSDSKHIPDVMMKMTKDSMAKFLSFMFACECSISEKSIEYSSKSLQCLEQIKLLLLRYGIKSYILEKTVKDYKDLYYRLEIGNHEDKVNFLTHLSEYLQDYKKQNLINSIKKWKPNFSTNVVPRNIVNLLMNQYPQIFNYNGGSVYNSNTVTRNKFNSLIKKHSVDNKWVKFYNGKQGYEEVVALNEKSKQIETYDFKMEGDDTPYIIANGLVIHNSAGKKDARLMAETKGLFIDGCKKHGVVDDETAELLWDNIEKSNRYSFNKCLGLNNKVYTREGEKSIGGVQIGDEVFSPFGWVKVINIHHNGPKFLYRFKFHGGMHIDCTVDHKMHCTANRMKTAYFATKHKIAVTVTADNIITSLDSIVAVEELGYQDTIDLEVDHPSHVFFCNGVAVSNSHSIGYGIEAYWTAYAKAHHKKEFYCAWLRFANDKLDPKAEVAGLVIDARYEDIPIYGPHLLKSKDLFDIVDENIYFGLCNIHGVGHAVYTKIQEKLSKVKNVNNWMDILFYVLLDISSTAASNLIESGALDYLCMSRTRMNYELHIASQLSKREVGFCQNIILECQTLECLLESLLNKGGCANKNRVAKVHELISSLKSPPMKLEDSLAYIIQKEKALLAVPVNFSSVNLGANFSTGTTCKDIIRGKDGKISLIAEVVESKEYTTKSGKNKGKKMCSLAVADETGLVESIMVFPNEYNRFQNILSAGNVLILNLKKLPDKDLLMMQEAKLA